MDTRDESIRMSFDCILRIEDALNALNNNVKVPYADNSGYFTKEELIQDLKYCYGMLHKTLRGDYGHREINC